jgi:Immunoglobulin domain
MTCLKTKVPAIASALALLLLPRAALGWSGDTWANITRATIKSNADLMIDSTWAPKNTITNWEYGTTYHTYTKNVAYTGVPYSQTYNIAGMVQQNWTEFRNAVTNTSGGTVAYGNDCSGFTSICWKLPTREVTATFESKLGGTAKWFSLGDIGTAATAPLVMGDALNSSSVGHIIMFLNYETTGVRTMEQTPNNAQRKLRSYSNVAEYRPIRRMQIVEERGLAVSGNLVFGSVLSGSSAQRTLTIKSIGLSAMTVSNVSLPAGFSGNWSGTIAPGGSRNVTITFSPTAVASYGGTLTVNSDAVAPTNTLAISGTGIVQAPQITAQPQGQSITAGQSATFTITASGLDPLSYQWRFNGAALAGATLSNYTRANAQFAHSGNYDIVVSNAYGVATSQIASLTVTLPPVVQTLWLDNFDANTAANWVMNRSSSDCRVTFNYNYSADGISSAPNSTNNTTRGVKFEANVSLATAAAINISPAGRSFGGDYRLRFDLWMNQNGPFSTGGNGSTQHGTAGLGTAGNHVQWTGTGSTADGYWFVADGEGQASDTSTSAMNDFGAFSGTTYHAASSGVYAAGTASNSRGNGNSYYAATFPGGQTAPALQQADYSQQTGVLAAGTIGFAWREVIINKAGDTVEWFIDGLKIATIPGANFASSNIFIGLWDSFNSLSDNTDLSFAVFDNVRVERLVTNVPPYLTAQPQAQTVTQGNNATFNVTAGGTATLSYQWRCNGTNLAGASASAYTVTNALPPDAGSYTVVVTNSVGSVTSAVASLTVNVPPTIPVPPESPLALRQGADATFCVAASGTAPLRYQWRFNGMDIVGATAGCYTRNAVQPEDAGTYSVVVTNVAGSATSTIILAVLVPPVITAQPQGQTNLAGASVTLSVTATGTAPLCYRWQCGGNGYPPGSNTFLACQAGGYSVVVSNAAGMVTSALATVVFTNPPSAQPGHFDSISRLADGSVQLNMSGTAGTNYILEWTSDWVGWSNLCTLSSADGSLAWIEPCATNSSQRFYRLRVGP